MVNTRATKVAIQTRGVGVFKKGMALLVLPVGR